MIDLRKLVVIIGAIIGVITLFVIITSPGLHWGNTSEKLFVFNPDEFTHASVAKNFLTRTIEPSSYVKGFPTQIAVLSFITMQKNYLSENAPENNVENFVLLGRLLSLLYGLGTVLLVFVIGNHFWGFKAGFFSALILATLDLFVSFSHSSVPIVPGAFWFLLATFLIYLSTSKKSHFYDLVAIIASTICFSVQFNFIPLIFILVVFLFRKDNFKNKAFSITLLFFVFISTYWISSGSLATYKDISLTIFGSLSSNLTTAIQDKQIWLNPILYLLALIAGTSIVTTLSSIAGGFLILKEKTNKSFLLYLVLPALAWLFLMCLKPNIFPRYAIVMIPIIALFSGYFIKRIFEAKTFWVACLIVVFIVLSPLTLTLDSQEGYLNENETRFEYYNWLKGISKDAKVLESRYVRVPTMNQDYNLSFDDNPDYIVLHELYYSRYIKKFTTGFGTPKCISGVHHPTSMENCNVVQGLVLNTENSGYSLEKSFKANDKSIERVLFRKLFGTYTYKTGELLVFKKNELIMLHKEVK